MSNTGKAMLLSALVFPGAGHFYLKKKMTGAILAVSAFFGLYSIVSRILGLAQQIADKIVSGEVQPDMKIITELLATRSADADIQTLNIATVVLIIAWVIGIVDSYRVGRIEDKIQKSMGFNIR